MIQGPDMREVVVVRCLVPEVAVVVPADEILEQEREGEVVMKMGEVWSIYRWMGCAHGVWAWDVHGALQHGMKLRGLVRDMHSYGYCRTLHCR